MRASTLAFLALAIAALLVPSGAAVVVAPVCDPIPQVVNVQCLRVPSAGAVGLVHVPTFGVTVLTTGSLACGPSNLGTPGATVTVTCSATAPCASPFAFAAVDNITETMSVQAACGGTGGATASCSTAVFPGNFCFGQALGGGNTTFVCTVTPTSAAPLASYIWYAECAQPVG